MSRIKSKDTSIEKTIRRKLRENKIKFRGHVKTVLGEPDFVVKDESIAIFCDSAFWHGYRFGKTKIHNFKRNKAFWVNKIKSNVSRDRYVTRELKRRGWTVMRFWDFEIERKPSYCINQIRKHLTNG